MYVAGWSSERQYGRPSFVIEESGLSMKLPACAKSIVLAETCDYLVTLASSGRCGTRQVDCCACTRCRRQPQMHMLIIEAKVRPGSAHHGCNSEPGVRPLGRACVLDRPDRQLQKKLSEPSCRCIAVSRPRPNLNR